MDRNESKTTTVEQDANAKLIALAPEMFDALKMVNSILETVMGDEPASNYAARVSMVLLSERSRITRLIDTMEDAA